MTEKLMDQLNRINWSQFDYVHLFLPISKFNEIDTFSVLDLFKTKYPKLNILIPRTNFSEMRMENVLFSHEHTILGRNSYGIPEPIHGRVFEPHCIDLIFVPLLAYDLQGNRVGYGKGFYDRFFKECRNDVIKMGLSFFDPVEQIHDLNEFDVKLDLCISPDKIYNFSQLPIFSAL